MIENLEFLTHRPAVEGAKALLTDPVNHDKRMEKLHSLVQLVNNNVQNQSQISFDTLVTHPKLTSFKLMKLDMEQSCRAKCEIESKETFDHSSIIANSTDQMRIQSMQQMKSNVALAQLIKKVAALRGNRQRGKVQVEHHIDSDSPDDFVNLQLASEMSTILDMDMELD